MLPWYAQLTLSVAGGISVASIIAGAKAAWGRRRVPTGLSRAVERRSYLQTIENISKDHQISFLDVYAPHLSPARGSALINSIQDAWTEIDDRGRVRIVTGRSQECLTAGAELLSKGLEVRVASSLEPEDLSYHLFSGGNEPVSVINYREAERNRPVRLNGISPARVFRSNFTDLWESSEPVESAMASILIKVLPVTAARDEAAGHIEELKQRYGLREAATEPILRHVAFRLSAPVIFLVGLPGAGKSLIRRRLSMMLRDMRFQVDELSDYVYAFRDFVHGAILLDETRGTGFSADSGGAFKVTNEVHLRPALHALAERVWINQPASKITLVEFARSDTMAALHEFGDDIFGRSRVIYVDAPTDIREERLRQRAEPPSIQVDELSINVVVSDNHRLPSAAASNLYDADDLDEILADKRLSGRVFRITNDRRSDSSLIDTALERFIDGVAAPYRNPRAALNVSGVAVS